MLETHLADHPHAAITSAGQVQEAVATGAAATAIHLEGGSLFAGGRPVRASVEVERHVARGLGENDTENPGIRIDLSPGSYEPGFMIGLSETYGAVLLDAPEGEPRELSGEEVAALYQHLWAGKLVGDDDIQRILAHFGLVDSPKVFEFPQAPTFVVTPELAAAFIETQQHMRATANADDVSSMLVTSFQKLGETVGLTLDRLVTIGEDGQRFKTVHERGTNYGLVHQFSNVVQKASWYPSTIEKRQAFRELLQSIEIEVSGRAPFQPFASPYLPEGAPARLVVDPLLSNFQGRSDGVTVLEHLLEAVAQQPTATPEDETVRDILRLWLQDIGDQKGLESLSEF